MAPRLDKHFFYWQIALTVLHYAAAIYVFVQVVINDSWNIPVMLRFNVWESDKGSCDGTTGCKIVEYERKLDDPPFFTGYLVPFFSIISGSHHFACALKHADYNKHLIKHKGVAIYRHVDYLLSAPLMFVLDNVLWKAPPTVQQLVFAWACMYLIILAGYGSEVAWSRSSRDDTNALFHAKLIYVLAVVPFLAVFAHSWIIFAEGQNPHSDVRPLRAAYDAQSNAKTTAPAGSEPPDFVIVILAWIFSTYALFPMVACYRLFFETPVDKQGEYNTANTIADVPTAAASALWTESLYAALSFLSKIPLLVVYASAVLARQDRVIVDGDGKSLPEVDESTDSTLAALGISAGISVLLGVVMLGDLYRCV